MAGIAGQEKRTEKTISISGRTIGVEHPPYFIAEIGFNHQGDVPLGIKMIDAAADAGAHAVKFQSFRAGGIALESSEHFSAIASSEMSLEGHKQMMMHARERGMAFLSTPFDNENLVMLEELEVTAYKVASMDLNNLPFLKDIARYGKPILLSTGMSTLDEIQRAIDVIKAEGNDQILPLHCLSLYPCPPESANVRSVTAMEEALDFPVGYSDHVLGNGAALAAVGCGAVLIEKHFTCDKTIEGADNSMSADGAELQSLVEDATVMFHSLGQPSLDDSRPDRECADIFRRSVFSALEISAGTVIEPQMLKCVRPGTGLAPENVDAFIGRKAVKDITKEQPMSLDLVEA